MRYAVLAASVVIQVCLGGLYAWSSFVPALRDSYGLSSAQTQLIFGLMIAVFTLATVPAGRLLERRGPRWLVLASGLLFAAGYLLASFSGGSFALLLVGIGVIAGIGTGLGYVCPLATGMRWFPDHKGLVTGLAVAGFGAGAVLLSNLAEILAARGADTLSIFRWIGIAYGVVIALAALAMRFPASGRLSKAASVPTGRRLRRDPFFYGLLVGIFSGTFAGLLVIGNLKPIVLAGGIPPVHAALAISVFAAGNASGRIAWGWLSDRFGQRTVWLSLTFLALAVVVLGVGAQSIAGGLVAAFLVGFGFGACFIVYAAQVASRFGPERLGRVYPFVFLGYGAAGVVGPWVGGWLYDLTGSYDSALLLSLAVVVAGLAGSLWLLRQASTGREEISTRTPLVRDSDPAT